MILNNKYMETNERQRLRSFIEYINLSNREFEINCSISNGYVSKDGNIRNDIRERILAAYPELNRTWLLTGDGNMLNDSNDTYINKVGEEQTTVPLVPLSAMAGKLTGFSLEGITKADCEKIISPIKGADFAVPVSGDSMYPLFPNGSRVLVQKTNPDCFIEWGKVYVLNTCNGIVVKQVRKSSRDGYVTCYSFNDNSIYAPFDIALADIHGWFKVLMCLSMQ
jgi:phage repressor protein C with HTH and peptisase S24 domain